MSVILVGTSLELRGVPKLSISRWPLRFHSNSWFNDIDFDYVHVMALTKNVPGAFLSVKLKSSSLNVDCRLYFKAYCYHCTVISLL